jgi:hypothetical protein
MRYFYRLVEGLPTIGVMNALLQNQSKLTDTSITGVQELVVRDINTASAAADRDGAKEFPALKKLALAIMQMIDGTALGRTLVLRAAPKTNVPLGNASLHYSGYAMVLHADPRTLLMAGDETVMIKTGDIWWADMKQDAHLINNSDDDAIILLADVMVDS